MDYNLSHTEHKAEHNFQTSFLNWKLSDFLVTAQSSFEINWHQQPSKSIRSCNKTAAKDVNLTVFYFH